MWFNFFLENIRFAISLFAGLVFFAVGWLYFDAWQEKKERKELVRYLGYFALAISFVLAGTQVESKLIEMPLSTWLGIVVNFLSIVGRIGGYLLIARSLLLDPIQPRPDLSKFSALFALPPLLKFPVLSLAYFGYPVLAAYCGLLYLKRTSVGYEAHLRPVALSFFILAFSEFTNLGSLFRNTTNVSLYSLVAPFGLIWFVRYLALGVAVFILGGWVFRYLFKRFISQLFMIFTAGILVVFLVTALSFSVVLVSNIRDATFNRLETDARVLTYAIEGRKAQTLADASLVAQNSTVLSSFGSRKTLSSILENFLLAKDQSFLWALDSAGTVVARGEDSEKYGDSQAGDALVKRALAGEAGTSVASRDGPFAPMLTLRAAAPTKNDGLILAGTTLDNAFVDGIKLATGLEASIYGGNTLAATTIISPDGKSRPVGIKEESKMVKDEVLEKDEGGSFSVRILGIDYLAAYLPLKDIETKTVGMLFVGEPEIKVLQTAGAAIQLTFLSTVILLILSVVPAYFVARHIARQIE